MARPKKPEGEIKDQRVPIVMSEAELKQLDDWMHSNRLRSRGDAIRRLCQIGILVDNELEGVVNAAVDMLNDATNDFSAARAEFRKVVNDDTADALFTQEHIRDIFEVSIDRQLDAMEAIDRVTQVLMAIYHAILPFTSADSVKEGAEYSDKVIAHANELIEKDAARIRNREDNRYLLIHTSTQSDSEREAYESLSEDEKEPYLDAAINNLKVEEATDPEAFHAKYGPTPFWEKIGWKIALPRRAELKIVD